MAASSIPGVGHKILNFENPVRIRMRPHQIILRNQSVWGSWVICIDTNMKDIHINIEELDYTKPISYYCSIYGLSENALRNRFKRLGIYNKFVFTQGHTSTIKSTVLKEEYTRSPKLCLECNSELDYKKSTNKFCSKKCFSKYNLKQGNVRRWSSEERQRLSESMIGKERLDLRNGKNILCNNCKKEFYVTPSNQSKCCSKKCYHEWANKIGYMKGKTGGYRKEAGRGKMGWYRGIYCNSTWELAWVIYSLDNNIKFKRNNEGFEYQFGNNKYKFYPDFILEDGRYVEIKGWVTNKDNAKFNYFPHHLIILKKVEMEPILKYVVQTYGKDYWKMYE